MRIQKIALALIIFCDELNLGVTHASTLAAPCFMAMVQRQQVLPSNEHPQRRIKLPIRAQPCDFMATRMTYKASPLANTTRKSKN